MSATFYLVTSFNFGGNSHVKVHIITEDLTAAESVYASVLEVCNAENARNDNQACKMLVELTHASLNAPLLGSDALTLFWGQNAVANNNPDD